MRTAYPITATRTRAGAAQMTHRYVWRNNAKRATMYNRPCRIVARGTMNSIMIEFEDGQREIVSRYAVRRLA